MSASFYLRCPSAPEWYFLFKNLPSVFNRPYLPLSIPCRKVTVLYVRIFVWLSHLVAACSCVPLLTSLNFVVIICKWRDLTPWSFTASAMFKVRWSHGVLFGFLEKKIPTNNPTPMISFYCYTISCILSLWTIPCELFPRMLWYRFTSCWEELGKCILKVSFFP